MIPAPDESYDAVEAGAKIGKSADWMKKQARLGRIPFTRVGQSMRWTPDHIREILRMGEQRPRAATPARGPSRGASRKTAGDGAPALRSKTPPRKRNAA